MGGCSSDSHVSNRFGDCFVAAVVFYFVVNRVFPAKVFPARYESTPKSFEKLVETEGCFDGEPLMEFGVINGWEVEDHASGEISVVSTSDFFEHKKV